MDLIEFFHKKYYPDLSAEQVAAAFGKPEVVEAAYNHVQKKYYPDLPPEKVRRIPIIVNNPNDPRLKAYNDSNYLYKRGEADKSSYLNLVNTLGLSKENMDEIPQSMGYSLAPERGFMPKNPHSTIQPTGFIGNINPLFFDGNNENVVNNLFLTNSGSTRGLNDYLTNKVQAGAYTYNKPVQPYVYEEPQNVSKRTPVAKAKPIISKPTYEEFVKTANPDYMGDDYDLEAAYKNLPLKTMQAWAKDPEKNHLPDTYKKPNHPTFSNESMYYKEGMPAVKWEGDKPIPINQPKEAETIKPTYTSKKQTFQGRDFMETTGLRPGLYHPEEVEQAKQNQMKKGKRAF
jgi:hypothetical protein